MRKIGCGVYGSVFFDKKRSEAVKKCFIEDSRDIWAGNLREMDILRRCGQHPNIVKLLGVNISSRQSKDYNKLALRMQYYTTNLQSYLSSFKDQSLDISTIRIIVVQILLALEYLHANKVIHRDLKPDNILINPDTLEIALCDFGMSEVLMKYQKYETNVTAPLYRAPEVFKNCKYSAEIDMWAVGLIMFSLIDGDVPFRYPTEAENEILRKMKHLDHEKHCDQIAEYENEIKRIVLNEIAKIDVKKSFSSTYPFRKLLDGLLNMDPNKRITATQALEDSFFDTVRHTIIKETREKYPPDRFRLRKISIEDIPERTWIASYTMKFISENGDLDYHELYPIVFHGLDIFEKYLSYCSYKGATSDSSIGKYLRESEVHLFLYTCFYMAHKFYAIVNMPEAYEDFFPEDLITDENMDRAEEFEEFLLTKVLDYSIFEFTLYEIAEEMVNNPTASTYYKILKEYLQRVGEYNSYRSLYREHITQKLRIN